MELPATVEINPEDGEIVVTVVADDHDADEKKELQEELQNWDRNLNWIVE